MRHVVGLVMLSLAAVACTAKDSPPAAKAATTAEPPKSGTPVAPVPVQLQGIGECRANTCTVHFAEAASGDVDTLSLTRCPEVTEKCGLRKGKLTETAQKQVRALAARLTSEKLEALYDCPGCADGPIVVVVAHHPDGHETRHVVDPTKVDVLPPVLREAATLVHSLSAALGSCEETDSIVPEAACKELREKDMRR